MVIQANMSPKAIVEVWENTASIFEKHHVSISDKTLESIIKTDDLNKLLNELNEIVGSSNLTCIEGG